MKIAFVTDDHQTISAHFVRAIYYEVFTTTEGKITQREAMLLKQAGIQPIMTDIKGIKPVVKAFINGQLVNHSERLH